ncbi:NADPH-dependent F420 reductase [Steroidobacter cummioxidans]|uniref:NADPH-dependent F420 reductase n=1 Tax=Steroidobacter cummioxidans TaxID=1803913 RepID=UPI0019D493AE|nr:NADPH-dependent F420 reductase [Steroidobacter cummioxidans]
MHSSRRIKTIAVLGGTGREGRGLALRWAHAGYHVIIGGRDAARAQTTAATLREKLSATARIDAALNLDAAEQADVVVLAVPFAAQLDTALQVRPALVGKVLIDVTVPLVPPKVEIAQLPGGSAVERLQAALGPEVAVVSAFQNVSAHHLADLDHTIECDVLICADDDRAAQVAVELTEAAGLQGWRCGPLRNSLVTEGLTSLLIAINRRYKVPGAGIRITGVTGAH